MKPVIMILALCFSLGISSIGLCASPTTDIAGTVIAKRSTELKASYSTPGRAGPKPGDKVDFIYKLQGIDIDAGQGEVSEVGENFVWIRILSGRPDLKHVALIHATGKPAKAVTKAKPDPQRPAQTKADSGWETSGSYQQIDPAQRYLSEIAAAHQRCDYPHAFRVAEQAKREIPDNLWLQQNYPALKTLSERSASYRQALEAAFRRLKEQDIDGSIEQMSLAMQNASVACGQDSQVRSLLEQARQMAKMERDAAIEAARQRGLDQARDSGAYRAEIEKKRADREAFGNVLSGNLLGLLGLFSSDKSSSYPPSQPDSDREMVNRLVGESEKNNSEMLNRWRRDQGWSTQSAPSPQIQTIPSADPPPNNSDWVGEQVRQSEQNNRETLQQWRRNEGWE